MTTYYQDEFITIYNQSSNDLSQIDQSIDMVITSPPYNVDKEYENGVTRDEYIVMVSTWVKEWVRILNVPGRFCVNVPQTMGSHTQLFSPLNIWLNAIEAVGLKLRDMIVWNQINSGSDTAWGSFASANSPWMRHQTENIIIGYKDQWEKKGGESTISHRDFTVWTKDIWDISAARHKKHPAVFPEELARRCIELFTYKSDVILDPFLGTGTTAWVAKLLGRKCIGIDIKKEYCKIASERCSQILMPI